ncbi:hypothetical protein K469DRAFT_718154 [Zopfia rhizophila CBS 207.26]|uniref:Serine-threonine protein kinase 19 n=1 Tax=Zopfia rhizophila CBS 207.26 TaxID=1314779 RepID=A0A6A6DGH7_9PEZI|nr:hypothetical protein K469DRAFT_718154 [Zopfia rhizophila CBS 207.26]
MSFRITPAYSSRVKKPRKPTSALSLPRSTSSPSSASPRKKRNKLFQPAQTEALHDHDERLDDTGEAVASLAIDLNFRDVPQYMQYIRSTAFSDIPERGAGMNSTRIAHVLTYRASLPPIVTLAHIEALSLSSTRTEREIVELAQAGVLRRVMIPHRGAGASAVGEGVALVSEWQSLVRSHAELGDDLSAKYISLMNKNPTSATIAGTEFTSAEISALTTAGFITTTALPDSRSSLFASPGAGSLGTLASLSSVASKHAAGSLAAVGGAEASKHISGGSGHRPRPLAHYNFSLPNTGSHIKLLIEARTHLLSLLKKSKYREAPMHILRERWDGGIATGDEQTTARNARGEPTRVLPGRTKKWKSFWGLRFEWVLEECVGAGLVELFETGSVGVGVRVV